MSFLKVDLDALSRTASDMAHSLDQLREARKKLSRGSGLTIGPPVLTDAADAFQTSWHEGLDRMAEAAAVCVRGLTTTHEAYEKTDHALTEVMHRLEIRTRP